MAEETEKRERKLSKKMKVVTLTTALVVGLVVVWVVLSPMFWGTIMADALKMSQAGVTVLLIVAVLLGSIGMVSWLRWITEEYSYEQRVYLKAVDKRGYGNISHEERDLIRSRAKKQFHETRSKMTLIGLVLASIMLLLLLPVVPGSPARQAYRAGFDSLAKFSDEVVETEVERPAYSERLNAVMAENILRASMQDTASWIPEDVQPQYSVVDNQAAWCVAFLAQHRIPVLLDRVYAKGVMCLLEETMKTVQADWNTYVPTVRGAYSTNLRKMVARFERGLSVAESDVRYYIQDGKPYVLAPVTKVVGNGFDGRRVTAGFITINPEGTMMLHKTAKAGEWPVPVIAYSTAAQVRESLNTRAGYYCRTRLKSPGCVKKINPLEDTSSVAGINGAGDPNYGNSTEFVLRRADGRLVMVSALTPYGNSRNVVAYLEVVVDELESEQVPAATLYSVRAEASGLSIAQAVTAAYTADISWTSEVTDASAQKAASRIYEITPGAKGEVVATIGNATNPEYLLRVRPTLSDGSLRFSYCMYTYDTNAKVDCRESTQSAARIGTLRGVAQERGDVVNENVDVRTSLVELTDAELAKLGVQIIEELARRGK